MTERGPPGRGIPRPGGPRSEPPSAKRAFVPGEIPLSVQDDLVPRSVARKARLLRMKWRTLQRAKIVGFAKAPRMQGLSAQKKRPKTPPFAPPTPRPFDQPSHNEAETRGRHRMDLSAVDNNILDELNARLVVRARQQFLMRGTLTSRKALHDQLEDPPAALDLERAEALLRRQKRSADGVAQSLRKLQKRICNRSRPLLRGDTSAFPARPHDVRDQDAVAPGEAAPATRRAASGRSVGEEFGYLNNDAIDNGPSGGHASVTARLHPNQQMHDSSFSDRAYEVLSAGDVGFFDPDLSPALHDTSWPEHCQVFRSTTHQTGLGPHDSYTLWRSSVGCSGLSPRLECRNGPGAIVSGRLVNAPEYTHSAKGHDNDLDTSRWPVRTDESTSAENQSDTSSETSSSPNVGGCGKPYSVPGFTESISPRIKAANSAHELPQGTLERFLPGQWLSDLNITASLRLLLPPTAEALVASQAIENMPKGGLACRWSTTDAPEPVLRHSQHCNHLFIAYNVVYGTLDDMGQDGNNHWVLLAVDMTRAKVHIFGVDSQLLEPGKLVALNVSTFINNCRGRRNDTPMNWSDPSFYPLYEHGLRPDTFNCGMAVISRAVSFLYPAWALNASGLADPVRLATRLSEWRCFCLCLFLDRYRVIHTENNLLIDELLSTNLPRKKPAISRPYEGREAQVFEMSQSLFLNYTIQGPAYLSLRDIHRWKSCILACAAANGFDENRVLEAFENAPDKPIEDVLRTLQCMCEVASSNILIQLKSALSYNQTNQVPHNSASTSADVEELSKLHIFINNCSTAVPFLSRFEALRGWISYSKCFDAAVASRAKNMKIERSVRKEDKRLAEKQKRIYNLRQKATVGGDPPRNKADHLVRRSLVNSLVQKGFDAEEAHLQIKDHLKYSKKLRLLLNDRDTCWLLLMPLQAPQQDMFHEKKLKPTLGLMDFKPPKRIKRLEKPISSNDLLQLNEELAHYFGRHLFTARPELRRLNAHVANIFRQAEVHALCQNIDSSIIASKPKNVVELFESTTT